MTGQPELDLSSSLTSTSAMDKTFVIEDNMPFQLKKEEEYCRNKLAPYLNGMAVNFVYRHKVDPTHFSPLPAPNDYLPVSLL
jgi:hypothetical protein